MLIPVASAVSSLPTSQTGEIYLRASMDKCARCGAETRHYVSGTPLCQRCDAQRGSVSEPKDPKSSTEPRKLKQ